MTLQAEIAGTQIDGARDYQEDAFLITSLTDAESNHASLIIVADGMGGHAAGNVASNMAVQAFNKSVTAAYPSDNISEVLNKSILKANSSIMETITETPALDGMGCTFVGAIIEGEKLSWASVGDSHLYLLRNKELKKLNADHSYGGFLDRMEALGTPVEAEPGLSRNMLMSAITGSDISEIDCPSSAFILEHNDKLIICSDGMDTLSEGKIIQYADWADNSKECSEALMDAVEEAAKPKQDNTTAVVIKITDEILTQTLTPQTTKEEPDVINETIELTASAMSPEFAKPTPEIRIPKEDVTSDEKSEKSKTGLILGVVAMVVIAVAVGGYFMFSDSKPDMASDQIVAEKTEAKEPEFEEVEPEEPEFEEVESERTVSKTAPKPKPVVAKTPKKTPKPAPKNKKEFQDNLKDGGQSPLMIVIPDGSFEMGSSASSRFVEERPRHTVHIKSFAVSKYEVTFAEYDKFAEATGKKAPNDLFMDRKTHPVIYVSWDDAYNYTKWLSKQTGKKYHLLSESEWEYAASTGKKSPFWWGYKEEPRRAHCFGCETGLDPRKPSKVGGFKANKFGLHDTSGNVAEWVKDCWHKNYKGAPSDNDVWEGGDCSYRVVRGGAYLSPQQSTRSAKRDKLKSNARYDHVGIRLGRELN